MNYPTNDRIGRALNILTTGLQPFVAARMEARYGKEWRQQASTARGGGTTGPLDAYGLLKTILDNWQEAFAKDMPRGSRHHLNFALDGRNAHAHATGAIDAVEALRSLGRDGRGAEGRSRHQSGRSGAYAARRAGARVGAGRGSCYARRNQT